MKEGRKERREEGEGRKEGEKEERNGGRKGGGREKREERRREGRKGGKKKVFSVPVISPSQTPRPKQNNTLKRRKSMHSAGFEPVIPGIRRLQYPLASGSPGSALRTNNCLKDTESRTYR